MTPDQIKNVAAQYRELFERNNIKPVRRTDELATDFDGEVKFDPALEHAHWMCLEIPKIPMTDEHSFAKANRWLAFVQGVLWVAGFRSINQMREDNR